tara:strand:+ start:121 stop:360 length:240 start_codon:yes stop_codon:yes gene_type:complete
MKLKDQMKAFRRESMKKARRRHEKIGKVLEMLAKTAHTEDDRNLAQEGVDFIDAEWEDLKSAPRLKLINIKEDPSESNM